MIKNNSWGKRQRDPLLLGQKRPKILGKEGRECMENK